MVDRRVLYIHPYAHESSATLPARAIAVANCLERPPLGLFAEEVTRAHVEEATLALLDLHWFLPMDAVRGLVAGLRAIRPGLTVVLGGITAAFFAEQLLAEGTADYVMTGDAEVSIGGLVSRTLAGERALDLPNVWRVAAPPPRRERLSRAAFDRLDWLTIEWFPTYARLVKRHHDRYRALGARLAMFDRFAWQSTWFPYLPLVRGCRRACGHCVGSYAERVLGPGLRTRSAVALARDLRRLEREGRAFVNLYVNDARFLEVYGEALPAALQDRPVEMDALVFFCGTPDATALNGLRASFAGELCVNVVHPFDLEARPGEPAPEAVEASFLEAVDRMARLARTTTVIFRLNEDPEPSLKHLVGGMDRVRLHSGRDWVVDVPDVRALRAGRSAADHYQDIREHSRHFLIALVLGTIVPGLAPALSRRLDLDATPDDWDRFGYDQLERRLLAEYATRVSVDRAHGFAGLDLTWWRTAKTDDVEAGWAAPASALAGDLTWSGGMTGPRWDGRFVVPAGEEVRIAPVPSVWLRDGGRIDIGAWPAAQVPALRVDAGLTREVRAGGWRDARGLVLWLDDGGRRREHRLPLRPDTPEPPPGRRPRVSRELLEAIARGEGARALRSAGLKPGRPRR